MFYKIILRKDWETVIDITDIIVPGIIKTLIDGIAFISNMEDVLMGEILKSVLMGEILKR